MDVIILAGGFGTRMRPLTYTRPKPLLPMLNRPILAHIISTLPEDVSRIILPVNYLREQIEQYFADHPDPRVVLIEEKDPLGTGGAIKNCADHLEGTFMVVNGDVVASLDYGAIRRHHAQHDADATISLWPVKEPWHFGVVQLRPDTRISAFVEKPPRGKEPSNLINAGCYVLEEDVLDHIPAGRFFSIEKELFQGWARDGHALYGYQFPGFWVDCGRPETLLEAHAALLRSQRKAGLVDGHAKIAADAIVEGYAIAEGCQIGPAARVQRSVLLPNVRLGAGVVVRDSVLGEGVEVEEGATLENAVVGDFAIIEAGSRIKDQKVGMRPVDVEV